MRSWLKHPCKERELQTIEVIDDDSDLMDCLLRFLYTGDFVTPKEYKYRRPEDVTESNSMPDSPADGEDSETDDAMEAEDGEQEMSELSESTSDEDTNEDFNQDGEENISELSDPSLNSDATENDETIGATGSSATTDTEDLDETSIQQTEIAQELAQIYFLADFYDLPKLKNRILVKMEAYINLFTNPIGFFDLVEVLQSRIPGSDGMLALWIEGQLPRAISEAEKRGEAGKKALSDYVDRSGPITEEMLEAVKNLPLPGLEWMDNRCPSCSPPISRVFDSSQW